MRPSVVCRNPPQLHNSPTNAVDYRGRLKIHSKINATRLKGIFLCVCSIWTGITMWSGPISAKLSNLCATALTSYLASPFARWTGPIVTV